MAKPKIDADGPGTWAIYRRLLSYAFAYKWRLAVALCFAMMVAVSFSSVILALGGAVQIIFAEDEDAAVAMQDDAVSFLLDKTDELPFGDRLTEERCQALVGAVFKQLRKERMGGLAFLGAVILSIMFIMSAARFVQEYLTGTIGARITTQLAREMHDNLLRMPIAYFEERSTGEILARFTNDVMMVNQGLQNVLVQLMREPWKALSLFMVALAVDVKLTVIGLVILPPVFFSIMHVGRSVRKSTRRSLQRISAMTTVIGETVRGIEIVKGFSMEEHESRRACAELTNLRRYLIRVVKANAIVAPLTEFLLISGLVGFIMLCGYEVNVGRLTASQVVILVGSLGLMMDPVRKLSTVNNRIQASVASAERVFDLIDAVPGVAERPDAKPLPRLSESIRFENVHFGYNSDTEVLRGIDFEIPKGQMVALVGASGSGKSTIAKLVPRFYDVTEGAIRFDGVDIRDVTFKSLRDQISIVTQHTILFDETVRENITFGRSDFDDDRVRAASRAAHADQFIERLPNRYESHIGEFGATLSGGQRQRLAIARALIKDPTLLILDEATSSLDSESEHAIQEAIEEFVKGRTTLVIAHRLSTIRRADRILVIDDGRIVEQGAHEALMAQSGIYRRLYKTQFASAES